MNKQHILGAITIALCLFAVYIGHQQSSRSDTFEAWKANFGVKFDDQENLFRKMIFERNLAKIEAHNADMTQTYKMAVNQFTALTDAEFIATYLGSYPSAEMMSIENPEENYHPLVGDIDWTSKGGVTPVKNQGQCGSCWAFSATGVTESKALLSGQSVSLSEQQLVDCSRPQGNQGCNGGWPSSALNYIKAYGISSESSYPYTARDGNCKTTGGSFKISGYASATGCAGLSNAINSSPVSVTVDASKWSTYGGGVFSNCLTSINHAVLLVGQVGGAWKIKNSWGTGWGESGFIRLAGGNTCGVCAYAGVVPSM